MTKLAGGRAWAVAPSSRMKIAKFCFIACSFLLFRFLFCFSVCVMFLPLAVVCVAVVCIFAKNKLGKLSSPKLSCLKLNVLGGF